MASETIIEHNYQEFDNFAGDDKPTTRRSIKADQIQPTDEFIKVSRYLSTIFAYNNVPLNLVGISLVLAQRMEFKTNIVYLLKGDKLEIGDMLGFTRRYKKNGKDDTNTVDKLLRECVKYDIIRPTETRGKYEVNAFLYSTGNKAETRQLQAHFDFDNDAFLVSAVQQSKITGETIRKAVANKRDRQIPGQMSLDDYLQGESGKGGASPKKSKQKQPAKKSQFNNFEQHDYDFDAIERQILASQEGRETDE